MITVIAGTNRKGSNTAKVAKIYTEKIKALTDDSVEFLDLADLPNNFLHSEMYGNPSAEFAAIQEKYLDPANKFVIIVPEYNGGIPGIFKLLIDGSDIKKAWYHKKALITGVASGRAGNLRGLDHLTNMLNYIQMDILKNKLPISGISGLLDENGELTDEGTLQAIDTQIEQFLAF